MATKRVSVSGLPQLSSSALINDPSLNKTRTSFLVSSRPQANIVNTSYQLDYAQLYTAISSQIANQFNITTTLGANNKPIYLTGQKFTASTKTAGSNTKPIYLSAGEFKESAGNAGGQGTQNNGVNYMKPIYLSAGSLIGSSISLGSNSTNAVRPLFMTDGSLMPITANSGAKNRPVYVEGGVIKPCFTGQMGSNSQPVFINDKGQFAAISGNIGNSSRPIYMSNGQFIACDEEDEELPRDQSLITGKRFELKQTVFFSKDTSLSNDWVYDNTNEESDHYNDPTAAFRVAHPSLYGKDNKCFFRGLNNPVNFKTDEAGWYLVHCEAGSKPMAVGIKIDGKWTHTHPYFTKEDGGTLELPNLIYIDSGNRQTIDPIFHLEEGVEIGVYSYVAFDSSAAMYSTSAWYSTSSKSTTLKQFKKTNGSQKEQYTEELTTQYTVNGRVVHTFDKIERGTYDFPFFYTHFINNINKNPGDYLNKQFWIYTKSQDAYKYYPRSTSQWKTATYNDTPTHGDKILTPKNNYIYDYKYASSTDGKNAIWGSSKTAEIYADHSYVWVAKGASKRRYTGVIRNIKDISYLKVQEKNEQWGEKDIIELLYLS